MGQLIGVQQLVSHPEAERRLTPYEALQLYTVNGAYAAFEETDKGSLAVGKVADLVALADDPLTARPTALASIPVDLTMVAGRVAHEALRADSAGLMRPPASSHQE
jgi:predicted amidohydrolase YtcJ